MEKPLKIGLHVTSLQQGGAEKVMVIIAEGLSKLGHQVDLVFLDRGGLPDDQLPQNVRLIQLDARSMLSSINPLASYLKSEKPDTLVTALHQPGIAAIQARHKAKSRTKVIVAIHSTVSQEVRFSTNYRQKLIPLFTRRMYPKADGIICVSRTAAADAAEFLRLNPNKIETIYNPVLAPSFFEKVLEEPRHPWLSLDNRERTLIAVGRLNHAKNFHLLLQAFALVRKIQDVKLVIFGEGEDRSSLEELIKELRLEESVQLPGFVQNPYACIRAARCLVLSSRYEGLPTVLIEALAAGTPIVSLDCKSGPKEILQDGKFGTLVSQAEPEALAEGIQWELQRPKVAQPKESWSPYLLDVSSKHYEAYIRKVLNTS